MALGGGRGTRVAEFGTLSMGPRAQGVGYRVQDLVRVVWGAGHSTVSMGRLEGLLGWGSWQS